MKTLNDYIDLAMQNSGAQNPTALSKILDISQVFMSRMRNNKDLPSNELMIKIADCAGIDRDIALIHLNIWKSEGQAKSAYENVLKRLNGVVASLLVFVASLSVMSSTASAKNISIATMDMLQEPTVSIYYGNVYVI